MGMTKDRARKSAARQRAAETGERYVVARRGVLDAAIGDDRPTTESPWPSNPLLRAMHDALHKIPGMPTHAEGLARQAEHAARAKARHHRVVHHQQVHPDRQPRVMRTWQGRIARTVSRDQAAGDTSHDAGSIEA
jgi:hypothetical protein